MINLQQMIEANEIFSDFDKRIALWCDGLADTNDLANLSNYIIENKINLISVLPEMVYFLWACLEKNNVRILSRYNFAPLQKNMDKDVSKLVENIVDIFKKGANGVQIFLRQRDFERFIDILRFVRNDLFFEHDLSVGFDINDISFADWDNIFEKLRDIQANSLVLTLNEDMGNRSDFVGRVYGMLQKWDFDGELHFVLNNDYERMDQVIRLVELEKSELADKLHFFLEY